MAKKKGFKIKTNKVPQEKFLVVTNAWGLSSTADVRAEHLNNVAAWFEIMLSERHPGTTLRSLYHQKTHGNLIVELPRDVADAWPYLGRHYYSQFTTNSPQSEQYAEIFEYKYARHGDPAEKNWTVGYPTYAKIPKEIPIRRPYPIPGLASLPPIDVADYAYPVPQDAYTQRTALLVQSKRDSESTDLPKCSQLVEASSSVTAWRNHPAPSPAQPLVTEMAEDFLANLSFQHPVVKEDEPSTDNADSEGEGDSYIPSSELLSLLEDLPPDLNLFDAASGEAEEPTISVKPEPMGDQLSDYLPSQELLDSIASLPQELGGMGEIKQEQSEAFEIRVKPEPVDDYTIFDNYHSSYFTSNTDLTVKAEELATVIKDEEDSKAGIQIKPEPIEDAELLAKSSSVENVKGIQTTRSRVPAMQVKTEVVDEKFSYEMPPKRNQYDAYVKSEDSPHSRYERSAASQRPSSNHHSNQYDDYTKAVKRERSLSQGINSRRDKILKRANE